ncbi:alpha/beta fold hydrolase [Pseudonocardia humida]|uniref:Alpha/beta hydrolase n=1 Tax=Pseudonocardia humida TaxID=2800819 RepID=A0ABT1A1L8_9PSEU|nr:alpha/beta hydrolase [Pseudonocardia humida]MCO1656897.1 alpha/beta hydrolase [Pseudonocardia humida]
MVPVHHRTATVRGHRVFYREAGDPAAPAVVLLHGFPTSSRMFRGLIPALARRYRVIAPDMLGFGHSDAPDVEEFDYTFDALAEVTGELLGALGVDRYALYVQDYGAPVGWRLALRHPGAVRAIITQSGNAYEDGFDPGFWAPIREFWAAPGPSTEAGVRGALALDAIRWQYLHGVAEPDLVDPDTWTLDHAGVSRPGNDRVQVRLMRDYATNPPLYPAVHEYFRTSRVPLLAVWGAGDEIFLPAGALAFARDLPDARIRLVAGGGHFLLETHLDVVVDEVVDFLATAPAPAPS